MTCYSEQRGEIRNFRDEWIEIDYKENISFQRTAKSMWQWIIEEGFHCCIIPGINLIFMVSNKEEAALQYLFLFLFLLLLSVSPPFPLLLSTSPPPPPPLCGIMGIVQVAWRSTLCPRRSRRRRAVMTCSTARSPSSPSQLIPALRSSVAVAVVGAMRVWAPSLELLVMCLAAVPILPLLPFYCCYHVCFKDASLCFPAFQSDWHWVYPSIRATWIHLSRVWHEREYSGQVISQQSQVLEMFNALLHYNAFRPRWWHFDWLLTPNRVWTFKPSGADADLDFNSELDQGYFTLFFLHGLLHMVGQHAYFPVCKCKRVRRRV